MPFATADGRTIDTAYADAGQGDIEMTGARVRMRIERGSPVASIVDDDGAGRWPAPDVEAAMAAMARLAASGDLDLYDEQGVDAWLI